MHVSDVALLHEQRDEMLSEVFDLRLSRDLITRPRLEGGDKYGAVTVHVDRTQFAKQYAERMEPDTPWDPTHHGTPPMGPHPHTRPSDAVAL